MKALICEYFGTEMVAKGDDGTFVYCLYIPALVVLRYAVTGVLFILNRIVSFQNTNSNILSMFCLATNYPLFCLHTLANKVLTKQRRYCMSLNLLSIPTSNFSKGYMFPNFSFNFRLN